MNKIIINCVVFGYEEGVLKVLLTKNDISSNLKWGTVSGILINGESTDEAAARILNECGIEKKLPLRQYKTFVSFESNPTRSIVIIGYYAFINVKDCKINSSISIYKRWKHVREAEDLIFGHNQMLDLAFYQFSKTVYESPVISNLLPEKFTLAEFSNLWQQILAVEIDVSLLCEKMLKRRVLIKVQEKQKSSGVNFYKFNVSRHEKLLNENFPLYF